MACNPKYTSCFACFGGGKISSEVNSWLNNLPPGYSFNPSSEDLVHHYLYPKNSGLDLPPNGIIEQDVYEAHPEILTRRYKPNGHGPCWYFFFKLKKRYEGGTRPNRSVYAAGTRTSGNDVTVGYWKASGSSSANERTRISRRGAVIGSKMSLKFFVGSQKSARTDKSSPTNWLMTEYYLDPKDPDQIVLCKIYKHDRGRQRGGSSESNSESAPATPPPPLDASLENSGIHSDPSDTLFTAVAEHGQSVSSGTYSNSGSNGSSSGILGVDVMNYYHGYNPHPFYVDCDRQGASKRPCQNPFLLGRTVSEPPNLQGQGEERLIRIMTESTTGSSRTYQNNQTPAGVRESYTGRSYSCDGMLCQFEPHRVPPTNQQAASNLMSGVHPNLSHNIPTENYLKHVAEPNGVCYNNPMEHLANGIIQQQNFDQNWLPDWTSLDEVASAMTSVHQPPFGQPFLADYEPSLQQPQPTEFMHGASTQTPPSQTDFMAGNAASLQPRPGPADLMALIGAAMGNHSVQTSASTTEPESINQTRNTKDGQRSISSS